MPDAARAGRVAIVHERFTEFGGSERVVEELHALFPAAPIFVPICERSTLRTELAGADVRVSPLQRAHRQGSSYTPLLPLLPLAFRSFDLTGYDLVITSHHAFANRIRVPADVPVLSYTHTPARWIWEPAMRARESGMMTRPALAAFARTQQPFDRRAARRVHTVVANSTHVARRVERWWGRTAQVVAPPVDVGYFTPDATVGREDFFLLAGRMVPYKQPEIAVAAATAAKVPLLVAGEGRARAACEAVAGPTVEFLGRVDDATMRDLFRRCQALLMPGEEDFGIVPVEAQGCGAPVLALGAGGACDTVVEGVTGHLYAPGTDPVATLARELRSFRGDAYEAGRVCEHAQGFAPGQFRDAITALVDSVLGSRG